MTFDPGLSFEFRGGKGWLVYLPVASRMAEDLARDVGPPTVSGEIGRIEQAKVKATGVTQVRDA